MVDAKNTRYGPSMLLTYGKGIAAASSMTRSSACPSLCASVGCMYWKTSVQCKFHLHRTIKTGCNTEKYTECPMINSVICFHVIISVPGQ